MNLAALLLSPPVEHWHPRSVAHLSLLREIDALAPVYLAALTSDRDDAPTQARMERLLRALPLCTPSGEIVRVPPREARRLLDVSDAAWLVWRYLVVLGRTRGTKAQEKQSDVVRKHIGLLADAVAR